MAMCMTIIVFITFSELVRLNQIFGYFIMYTKFQLDNQSHQIQCMYNVIINCTLHYITLCVAIHFRCVPWSLHWPSCVQRAN